VALDGSASGHDGTLVGGAVRQADVPSALSGTSATAIRFSGGTQHVRVAAGIGYHDSYTVSMWLRRDASQSSSSPRVFDYGNRRVFLFMPNPSLLQYYVRNAAGTQYLGGQYSIDLAWHHVVAQLDGDTMRLYVDGAKVGSGAKTGALSTADDLIYIGAENGSSGLNGMVDDVRFYSRALNPAEVGALFAGQGTQIQSLNPIIPIASAPSAPAQILRSISDPQDLTLLHPWGNNAPGTSAFISDTVDNRAYLSLSASAMSHARFDTVTDLRGFTARDYRFSRPIVHDTEAVTIQFDAKWDSAASRAPESSYFSLILMDQYPDADLSGLDVSSLDGNPYGTPALSVRILPGADASSSGLLAYGGANLGRFDTYNSKWWLPGSVSPTVGSIAGAEYPLSSVSTSSRTIGTTSWARYTYRILPDRQEIFRNDTLLGVMDLPARSTAPDYEYYDSLSAVRLFWRGGGQCYVSNLSIATQPDWEVVNVPPRIALTSPARDTSVLISSGMYLQANASDDDNNLDRVEFYAGSMLLGVDRDAPYNYSWYPLPVGTHTVTAVAVDRKGAVTAAKVVKVEVR